MRHATLLVHYGGSEVECDTIFVRHTITYPGTDLEGIPVEKDGVTTIWAPVNIGATRLPTKIYPVTNDKGQWITLTAEQVQSNFEQQGYQFQWGRKIPFRYPVDGSQFTDKVKFTNASDYLYYEGAVQPGYGEDKFIMVNYTFGYSWFKYDDINTAPSSIQAAGNIWPRQNDPCPIGWRIPTKEEFENIVTIIGEETCDTPTDLVWKLKSIPGVMMRWSPTIRGTIGPADLWRTFAPDRLPVSFNLPPGPAARQAATEITIQACGEAMPKARGRKAGGPEASAPEVGTPGTGAPKASDPESGTPKGSPKSNP